MSQTGNEAHAAQRPELGLWHWGEFLHIKGGLSDFCQTMLIFESTKTYMPITQQEPRPYFISPPHTYVHNHSKDDHGNKWRWHTSIFKQNPTDKLCELKQCKINITHLSRRNNATLAFDLSSSCSLSVLSTTGKLLRYLRRYLLPDRKPFCSSDIFLSFYFPFLPIYNRSANIHPVHSN